MADAQGEEFKHFAMDLEFLLRRTPRWREIAEGRPLQGRRHRRARRGGRGRLRPRRRRRAASRGGRRLARNRQPEGRRDDEPPTARAGADLRAGWELLDDEARERLQAPLAARRLVDFAGPHGWEHSATNLGRTEEVDAARRRRRHRGCSAGCCRWSSCGPSSRSRGPSCADNDRGAVDADLDRARRGGAADRDRRERRRLPRLGQGRHRRHRRGLAGRGASRSATSAEDYPRSVARAVEALREAGSKGPTAWPSAPTSTRG